MQGKYESIPVINLAEKKNDHELAANAELFFNQEIAQLEEIEPVESATFICGKWGCLVP